MLTFSLTPAVWRLPGTSHQYGVLTYGTVSMNKRIVPANVTKTLNGAVSVPISPLRLTFCQFGQLFSTTYTLSADADCRGCRQRVDHRSNDISSGASFALARPGVYGTAVP